MKQTVLDVLMYIFEHCMEGEEPSLQQDREALRHHLRRSGFDAVKVNQAFDWLEGLALSTESDYAAAPAHASVRLYAAPEQSVIGPAAQGLLLSLEQEGVIDAVAREVVIDRLLALGGEELEPEQLEWVVSTVLYNLPGPAEEDLPVPEWYSPHIH